MIRSCRQFSTALATKGAAAAATAAATATATPRKPLTRTWIVPVEETNTRLDRFLRRQAPSLTQSLIQKLIRRKKISVDDSNVSLASYRVHPGESVRIPLSVIADESEEDNVYIDKLFDEKKESNRSKSRTEEGEVPKLTRNQTQWIRSLILYEDAHTLVLNKPPNLITQGASTPSPSSLPFYYPALLNPTPPSKTTGTPSKPTFYIVHRLDRQTSGTLLLSKTLSSSRNLSHQFHSQHPQKLYWALLVGVPHSKSGRIIQDIAYKKAITYYRVVEKFGKLLCWVELIPKTGRKHQLRRHCAEVLGCPIAGEWLYEGKEGWRRRMEGLEEFLGKGWGGEEEGGGLCLHARRLRFCSGERFGDGKDGKGGGAKKSDRGNGKEVEVIAPLPEYLKQLWKKLNFEKVD